jgi:hypothetical protein
VVFSRAGGQIAGRAGEATRARLTIRTIEPMNAPFSSSLHLITMGKKRHSGLVVQAEVAGRRCGVGVRHA